MIKFEETKKRQYTIKNNGNKIIDLDLMFSPITNKFSRLTDFIEDCSLKIGEEFDNWYCKLINDYKQSDLDYSIVKNNIDKMMEYCDKYLELKNVNFKDYINKSKISRNSIFFDEEDIKKIVQVSNYLKIYFIISQDQKLKLPIKFHKEVYNKLVSKITTCSIVYKLYKIVSSKTYEYNHTDKYMWDYIKNIYCKTTDMHIMSIFNFIMNNILVTCDSASNPIPYLISVIDESIKWILKNIYKDAIIYSETISTQDVYSVQGKDNLNSYAHNDTIGKLLILSYNKLEEIGIENIDKFKQTISGLKEISLFANYITYPILSKVLDIPFRHFLTIPVSNSYLLNILMFQYLPKDFKDKYPTIKKMLLFYNTEKPIIKTTYKIKNLPDFLKTFNTFLSFKSYIPATELYSSIIGKLSRNSYTSFLNDRKINNFPLARLETDMVNFYNDFFNSKLDVLFKQIEVEIDKSI